MVVPFVVALFFVGCPAAIAWLVVSIGVRESVNRMFEGRSFTHIGKEVSKSLPSLANLYSTSTPFGIAFVLWIFATLKHAMPSGMFWRTLSANAMAMLHVFVAKFFSAKTSARLALAVNETLSGERLVFAALALAHKLAFLAAWKNYRLCFADNRQSTEFAAS